jgi:hypothetical protein
MFKVAPLKSSFMLISMLGFMITIIYTSYGRISSDWGFALGFVFALMFIASMISMTKAPMDMQLGMAPPPMKPKEKAVRKPKRRAARKVAAKPKKAKKAKAKPKKKAVKKKARKKPAKKAKPKARAAKKK